jgi:CheY-like chemotaxis protein
MKKNNYTIFLADDDEDDRQFFEEVLEEISPLISFITFDNGVDLIRDLSNLANHAPDYIFLDLNMPLMDGEECLQEIRNLRHLDQIPVVIYSTAIDFSKAERLRDKGASLYLKKPNTFRELKIAILNCIADVETNLNSNEKGIAFIVQL